MEYALLRINAVNAATSTSRYVVDGVRVVSRDESDEAIHSLSWDNDGFIPLDFKDADGKKVNIVGNRILAGWRNTFGGSCAGCEYCYNAFQDKGLLKMEVLNDVPDYYGFRQVNVTLTDEGKKYVIKWEDENDGNMMVCNLLNSNTGDAVAVKLMERVYTGAKKVKETDTEAVFYLQYYLNLTPFGEVLFGNIPHEPGFQSVATYTKYGEDEWKLSSLEDIRRNAEKREF